MHTLPPMSETFVDNQIALERLCQRLEVHPWVALDTEFMREQTYFAQLCLIQVATPEFAACIDPLAVDLEPLLTRLYDPNLIKVFHAGRQDLELLFDLRGTLPTPVFDTQIAAALLGFDDQIGYAPLVEALASVKLEKGHTRTNWAARPLSTEQLHYARDDVVFLRDVYLDLRERLRARNRLGWLQEECARLTDPTLYRNDPESLLARIKQGHLLDVSAQHRLRDLLLWRERTARAENLPRNWVVHDVDLFAIARAAPRTRSELDDMKIAKSPRIGRWERELLGVVEASNAGETELWPAPARLSPAETRLYDELMARIRLRGEQEAVNAALITNRKELVRLVQGRTDVALLRGWRRAFVGEELLTLMNRVG
jgi:ribonuclease D